ncbi:pyridoxal-phosphate dependent enzyme [Brucella pituitosa]|uniref:pyridoxal-phosphate dependent enzyme n=1 Tax=Brucella pituitosa TaxID=571256 RepID=UPI003F4AC802
MTKSDCFFVEIDAQDQTICDALRVTEIGSLAFSILQKIGARTLAASDAGVIEAQAHMGRETGIQTEFSGALALAAISEQELPRHYRRLWVIVCGPTFEVSITAPSSFVRPKRTRPLSTKDSYG